MNQIKGNILAHFKQRLMERFGLSLTNKEVKNLCEKFINYEIKPQYISKSGKTSISIIEIKGIEMAVVFDWEFEILKTCLRKNWVIMNEDGSVLPRPKNEKKPAKYIRAQNKLSSLHAKSGGTKYKGTNIAKLREEIMSM